MNPPLASRLSLTGMLGLATLTATHWLRAHGIPSGPVLSFVIGVTPNAAAAVAMPLILASILPSASAPNGQRAFLGILAFTTAGLCVWEFVQAFNRNFVFDVYDLTATGVGSALAYGAYLLLKR